MTVYYKTSLKKATYTHLEACVLFIRDVLHDADDDARAELIDAILGGYDRRYPKDGHPDRYRINRHSYKWEISTDGGEWMPAEYCP